MPQPNSSPPPTVVPTRSELAATEPPPIPTIGRISPEEVHAALAAVNRGRFKLLARIANLRLFDVVGEQYNEHIQADDHPIIATILKMRDELAHIPRNGTALRLKGLESILNGLKTAVTIGETSAESLGKALTTHMEFEQRKKEHEDKMALLREKLSDKSITIEQLTHIANSATEEAVPPGSIFDTMTINPEQDQIDHVTADLEAGPTPETRPVPFIPGPSQRLAEP